MFSGLATVLDRLQALFGKGYLLAGVFPFLILSALCTMLGDHVFPSWRLARISYSQLSATEQIPYELAFVLLLGLLGFVFWTLNAWFRQVLEGRGLFPAFLQQMMAAAHQSRLDSMDQILDQLRPELVQFRQAFGAWRVGLKAARQRGAAQLVRDVPDTLKQAYQALRRKRARRALISFAEFDKFFSELENELRSNPADKLKALDLIHQGFARLSQYALSRIETEYYARLGERKARYPDGISLGATRMGIIAQIPSDYSLTRYGFDLEAFWLIIQKLVAADDKFSSTLDGAKTQLDFAVGITSCLALYTAFAFAAALYRGTSISLFIFSFVAGILATRLFYEVAVQSYYGYTQAVKTAVDMYRLEALDVLRIFAPTDSDGERQIWDKLTLRALTDDKRKIDYKIS